MSSNLPRVTQKIFAENTETNIGQFGSAKNGSPFRTGDIQQIQALSAWGQGWDAAVISDRNYPPLEEMTGVQKVFSQQIAYILQKGMPEWDTDTTYYQNDICRVGSLFYYSKTDSNTGNNPETDNTNWGRWNPAEGTYANIDLSNLSTTGQAILDSKLNHTQVTNCILANNGAEITTQSYEDAAYVNNGCSVSEAGVASGFGTNNFILLNKTMTDANAFVMTIPFKVNSTAGIQPLAAINNQENCIQLDGGVLSLKYNGLELKGSVVVSTAVQYYAVLTRTETGYTLELKDSTEPETEALDTITLTSTAGFFGGKSIYLGVDKSGNFLNGEIDLGQMGIGIPGQDEVYWDLTKRIDFETVTLSGSLQVLMPDGRNADQTLKNVEQTITLNDVLLFNNSTGNAKTVLVKQDGEVMIRDFYAETEEQPDVPLNGVWFDIDNNVMNTQLNTYPNFINTGVTIESGVVSGFSAENFLQLPEQYNLGGNWNISLALTPAAAAPTEPTQPTDATDATDPTEPTAATPCGLIGNIEVTEDGNYIPDGIGLVYDGTGNVTAIFRRNDVYNVRKTIVLSTAYEVQKGSDSTIGYVQTAGDSGTYVAAETQVYSDTQFTTPFETAAADTWQYTGQTEENTQILDGYSKIGGKTLVPENTVIYSDADCKNIQGTATGADYVYTGYTSTSIIGTLTDTITDGQENTISLSYDGANYKLNQKTLASTDTIRNNIVIPLGKALSDGGYFTGTINLTDSTFSFWTWNGVGEAVADLVPFVGVKIGQVTVNSEITNPNINIEGTLTNNNGIFSGFSAENTLETPGKFQPDTNPWEMIFKVTTGDDDSTYQCIALLNSAYGIHFGIYNSKFVIYLSTNGSSWDLANSTAGTYTVLANTEYYVQVNYTGSAYTLSYSLTGEPETFTQDISVTSSTPLNFDKGTSIIGGNQNPWLNSIDLNESYININGEQWWQWNGLTATRTTYTIGTADIDKPLNLTFKQMVLDAIQNANPIGRPIFCLNGESLNSNEIWLEGAEVSKAAYAELYAVYGDTYGEPEDENNFLLPDFRNRSIWGSSDATFGYQSAALPNIKNTSDIYRLLGGNNETRNQPLSSVVEAHANVDATNSGWEYRKLSFDASIASPIYQDGATVIPPSLKVRFKTRYK